MVPLARFECMKHFTDSSTYRKSPDKCSQPEIGPESHGVWACLNDGNNYCPDDCEYNWPAGWFLMTMSMVIVMILSCESSSWLGNQKDGCVQSSVGKLDGQIVPKVGIWKISWLVPRVPSHKAIYDEHQYSRGLDVTVLFNASCQNSDDWGQVHDRKCSILPTRVEICPADVYVVVKIVVIVATTAARS